MKKGIFYPALVALILANIIVYSCQKEKAVASIPAAPDVTVTSRSAACPQLTIANAVGFGLCNMDNGTGTCPEPCPAGATTNVPFNVVATNPQNFAFQNSDVFSVYNPTNVATNVTFTFPGAGAGCASQVFLIPAMGSRTFRVTFDAASGCCIVTSPC